MLEYLSSGIELDKDLNAMGAKEQNLFIDIVLNIVVSKLKSLKYIVTSYDKQLSFLNSSIGIKIYWDPNDVPEGYKKL